MKRRRNSTANGGRAKGKVIHLQINYSGPSLSDLPDGILVNILPRLSIKRIFVCKCVCKSWYDLISDPHFAKLHFDQAQVYPLIRTSGFTSLSRMLYLVQPDDFDMCSDSYPIKIKLSSTLKLPLRNMEMIHDKPEVESENCIKLRMKDHKYRIVNSCNGLLCLSNPTGNWPVIVCNPITGEFINLPESRMFYNTPTRPFSCCGFGFSPATKQYKVIKMLLDPDVRVGEVHTLGTETWRVLPILPKATYTSFATYLDGCVYWSPSYREVISFDIEKECFKSISLPLPLLHSQKENMGVLGGELYLSVSQNFDLNIWTMKDNGAMSQVFSFRVVDNNNRLLFFGSYQPSDGTRTPK